MEFVLKEIKNRGLCVGIKDSSGWMSVTDGKSVCIARLSSHFVPIPEHALQNPRLFMELGNCSLGEHGLAEVVHDLGDLVALVNAMLALHNGGEGVKG
jgi:hypothetical protein